MVESVLSVVILGASIGGALILAGVFLWAGIFSKSKEKKEEKQGKRSIKHDNYTVVGMKEYRFKKRKEYKTGKWQ